MKKSSRSYAKQLVNLVINKPGKLNELADAFWRQVIVDKHFSWRHRIIQEVETVWYEVSGQTKVTVAASRVLSETEKKDIFNQLKKKITGEFVVDWQIKTHLLGGLIITIDDERFDLSFKGQLDKLYFKLSR